MKSYTLETDMRLSGIETYLFKPYTLFNNNFTNHSILYETAIFNYISTKSNMISSKYFATSLNFI